MPEICGHSFAEEANALLIAEMSGPDGPVALRLDVGEDAEMAQDMLVAVLGRHAAMVAQARKALVVRFLTDWNDGWRPDGVARLTASGMADQLCHNGVTVGAGFFEIWFEDGGLFLGHSLLCVYLPESAESLRAGEAGPPSPEMFG